MDGENRQSCLPVDAQYVQTLNMGKAWAVELYSLQQIAAYRHEVCTNDAMVFIDVTGNVVRDIPRLTGESAKVYVTCMQVPVSGALSRSAHPLRVFTLASHSTTTHCVPVCVFF